VNSTCNISCGVLFVFGKMYRVCVAILTETSSSRRALLRQNGQ